MSETIEVLLDEVPQTIEISTEGPIGPKGDQGDAGKDGKDGKDGNAKPLIDEAVVALQAQIDEKQDASTAATDEELGEEADARKAADASLQAALSDEEAAREAAVAEEAAERQKADDDLAEDIAAGLTAAEAEVTDVVSDLKDETDTREAADTAEAKARVDGDTAEAAARTTAIENEQAARSAAIDGEREDREAADSALTKATADAQATADAALPIAGGTMAGDIVLPRDPDAPLKAATKQYTDATIVAAIEDLIGTAPEALDTLGEVAAALKKAQESDESALKALTALIETKLAKASNGSDIPDVAQFRTNIGLGTAATHAAGDFDLAGAAAAAQTASQPLSAILTTLALASKVEAFGRELLELATAAKVREKLGLGSAATQPSSAFDAAGAAATEEGRAIAKEAELQSEITTLENLVTGAPLVFKGVKDCSGNPKYPAAKPGHTYIVSVAGKIGGGAGEAVEPGDALICVTAAVEGTQVEVGSKWIVLDSATAAAALVKAERERAEAAEATKAAKSELGTAAKKDAGAAGSVGKVLNADDPTTTDARTPTKHAASHKTGSTDPLAPSDIGAAPSSALTAEEERAKNAEATKPTATLDTDNTLAANSDTRVPSQKAVKGYVTTQAGLLVPKTAIETDSAFAGASDEKVPSAKAVKTALALKADASALPTTAVLNKEVGPIKEQTVLQNITGISLAIGSSATERWLIQLWLEVEAANTTMDLKLGLTLPEGCTGRWGVAAVAVGVVGSWGGSTAAGSPGELKNLNEICETGSRNGQFGVPVIIRLKGGGKAGTLQPQYAQLVSSSGNLSILDGTMVARKVAS